MTEITPKNTAERHFFRASAADFKKIPGNPIAYWLSRKVIDCFADGVLLGDLVAIRGGMTTANNERFVRLWYEVSGRNFVELTDKETAKWFPYNKGGEYRRWYGNRLWVVNWANSGAEIKETGLASVRSEEHYFSEMIGWTDVTSYSQLGVRYYGKGFIFDASGPAVFPNQDYGFAPLLGFLGSGIASVILQAFNATLHVQAGNIANLPWLAPAETGAVGLTDNVLLLVNHATCDWDASETSWDFSKLPIFTSDVRFDSISASYAKLRSQRDFDTQSMLYLEEQNNRIFIDAYGLQDELTPDVPLEEITLTCNPVYRYGAGKTEAEYEQLQRTDTMKELISYAVGCMMGRYSPDTPGLQFAGGAYDHEKACAAAPRFHPDADGILPVLAEAYFEDDVTTRFAQFLKATFGPEHLSDNLRFVAEAIGIKGSESPQDAIRRFLANDFFKYHTRMYKKRPIYWLFSSGKEKAFQALVYLHRYTPATLARMRTGYLHELQNKLRARIEDMEAGKDAATSTAQTNRINRDLTKLRKQLEELRLYDEKLHHYADQRIEIDLDDGVKHNYGLFGDLLADVKAVTGDKG